MLPYSGLISRGENFEIFADFAPAILEILTTKVFRHSVKGNLSGEMALLRPIYS